MLNRSTCSILYKKCNPLYTSQYTFSAVNTQFIVCPVIGPGNDQLNLNVHNHKQDSLQNRGDSTTEQETKCTVLSKHSETEPDETINIDRFTTYDQSALNKIDPDINYLNAQNSINDTQYYTETSFMKKIGKTTNLSLFHLNIRSIPDHFLEFTSFLNVLNVELKVIALSETWIKAHHISYNLPNYNMEQNYRLKKRGGGVCLYLHNTLQYKVRDDLKLGNDPETVNSIFVEVDKSSADSRHNLIIGCIYRPPWLHLTEFNDLLSTILDMIVKENKIIFLLGDFNVNMAPNIELSPDAEEFKNIFFSHHLFPLINKPTRETKHTATVIDNIFCNATSPLDICDVGILRPYISDHHGIFCVMNSEKSRDIKQSYVKRNFTKISIKEFIRCINRKIWDVIYHCDIQTAFTRFQDVYNLNFEKCFPKKTYMINYKNRHPWMTANLRSLIIEKNRLRLLSHKNPGDLVITAELKQNRNQLTSDLRNAEIRYYSKQLELNKRDLTQSWKILKTIIGKGIHKTAQKISFCINGNTVTESESIANEFNEFFTTIGSKLSSTISCTVNPMSYVDIREHSIYIAPTTTTEIKQIIISLKNSSPGWDEIPAFLLKICSNFYVKPLTYLINKSIEEGIFPNELKLARVVPIFKSGNPSSIWNYRPISVLSCFSKIFERFMYNHVVEFININTIIYKYQFGFRQKHSTQQAIITLITKITSCIDSGDMMIRVFLDLKKAFDTVNHSLHTYKKNVCVWH